LVSFRVGIKRIFSCKQCATDDDENQDEIHEVDVGDYFMTKYTEPIEKKDNYETNI
jgi:hypothetical protein